MIRNQNELFNIVSSRMAFLALVILGGYLQAFHLISIRGVNPNIAAVAIVAYMAVDRSYLFAALAALISYSFLFSSPAPFLEAIAFMAGLVAVGAFRFFWPMSAARGLISQVAVFMLVFYLIDAPHFIYSSTLNFISEFVYNSILAALFLLSFRAFKRKI